MLLLNTFFIFLSLPLCKPCYCIKVHEETRKVFLCYQGWLYAMSSLTITWRCRSRLRGGRNVHDNWILSEDIATANTGTPCPLFYHKSSSLQMGQTKSGHPFCTESQIHLPGTVSIAGNAIHGQLALNLVALAICCISDFCSAMHPFSPQRLFKLANLHRIIWKWTESSVCEADQLKWMFLPGGSGRAIRFCQLDCVSVYPPLNLIIGLTAALSPLKSSDAHISPIKCNF